MFIIVENMCGVGRKMDSVADSEASGDTLGTELVCYDVRYDGECVLVYNSEGRMEQSLPACLYKGAPEVVKKAGGRHVQNLNENEAIVINPKVLTQLTSFIDYGWYVKDRILKENGYRIHTGWKPIFLTDKCSIPSERSADDVYVVPSIKRMAYGTLAVIPLLETIIHIHQRYNGMTLCQIACTINNGFEPAFNNMKTLMAYLFEAHRAEFIELCLLENIPLHKLYQSTFNLTFGHNIARTLPMNNIKVMKQLEGVYLVPLSRFFHQKTYGDIPWLIWNHREKDEIIKKAKAIIYPLAFFDNKALVAEMKEAVFFQYACILPEIIIDGLSYPAGSIMGVMAHTDGSFDTVLRGELFEGVTLREQIILILMYGSFLRRTLTPTEDCSDVLRNMAFQDDQITVRKPFIKAIQAALFRTR
jgi:hypothetical protein